MRETLKQRSDADLKAIIADAQSILDERDKQRKDEAMRQIRAIAAEHGLSIEAKKAGKNADARPKLAMEAPAMHLNQPSPSGRPPCRPHPGRGTGAD